MTYPIFLAKFGDFPMELYVIELTMGLRQWLIKLSPFWLVIKQSHSLNTLRNKDL